MLRLGRSVLRLLEELALKMQTRRMLPYLHDMPKASREILLGERYDMAQAKRGRGEAQDVQGW